MALPLFAQEHPPKILEIYRERLNPGSEAAYAKIEQDVSRICAKLNCPHPYLGIESVTGKKEVWWLNAFESEAEFEDVGKRYSNNAAITLRPRRGRESEEGTDPGGRQHICAVPARSQFQIGVEACRRAILRGERIVSRRRRVRRVPSILSRCCRPAPVRKRRPRPPPGAKTLACSRSGPTGHCRRRIGSPEIPTSGELRLEQAARQQRDHHRAERVAVVGLSDATARMGLSVRR